SAPRAAAGWAGPALRAAAWFARQPDRRPPVCWQRQPKTLKGERRGFDRSLRSSQHGAGAALATEASSRTGRLRAEPDCASSPEARPQYGAGAPPRNASFLGVVLENLMN